MVSDKTKFRPVYGTEAQIDNVDYHEGWLYIASDTGKIQLDADRSRIVVGGIGGSGGGGSSSIFWGFGDEEEDTIRKETSDASDGDPFYYVHRSAIEGDVSPTKDALIINSDGRFFKVLTNNKTEDGFYRVELIAVSGGGSGGGGGGYNTVDLSLAWDNNIDLLGSTYIYGQSSIINFYPHSDADETVSISIEVTDQTGQNPKVVAQGRVFNDEPFEFDTSKLPLSKNLSMSVTINSNSAQYNRGRGLTKIFEPIQVVEMGIEKVGTSEYIPAIDKNGGYTLSLGFIPIGDSSITETLHVYVDGVEVADKSRIIGTEEYNQARTVSISHQDHGLHKIELSVSTTIGSNVLESNRISFEAAWYDSNETTPIIWVGDYNPVVVKYESASIPFMVYNPEDVGKRPSQIILYRNGAQVSELEVEYSSSNWIYWDISAIYEEGPNTFSIQCGVASKTIQITVTKEGSRALDIIDENESSLVMNFSAAGRSSSELQSTRNLWTSNTAARTTNAILEGFNWANNGWVSPAPSSADYKNGSYLSIANGAKLTIPMSAVTLNEGAHLNYSFEFRFRVKNVQKYSTLVTTIPTYFYIDGDGTEHKNPDTDGLTLKQIEDLGYTVLFDEYGSPWMNDKKVIKETNTTTGILCKWLNNNGEGFVIGTQEAFFKSPDNLVSVRYKEDEVINLSFIISADDSLAYIYLNGVLSGATPLAPLSNAVHSFTIYSNLEFNSDFCDIDLYRIRYYSIGLTMPNVIHNYLSDLRDIAKYDQNQLTFKTNDYALSYEKLVEYNESHPDEPTMPYATWKITQKDEKGRETLPYYKGDERKVTVNFVNAPLDRAYDAKEFDDWYYYTHCPSFEASSVDINVQGTSSQGYPRRNYKLKFKKAKNWKFTYGPLAGQLMNQKWYFQNVGTEQNPRYEAVDPQLCDINVLVPPISKEEDESDESFAARTAAYEAAVSETESQLKSTYDKVLSKDFHMDNESIGTNKFTWKIDYMESSGTYNTGFANLMGNLEHPLYMKHPLEDQGINASAMRTSVYGFPLLVFHEYENAAENPTISGQTYEYIGRYNMNLDKGSNEYYGFEEKTKNAVLNKSIKDIAESWELSDNQGNWCSWRFPNAAARETGFGTLQEEITDGLEMMTHFEYRYSKYGDQLDAIGAKGKYDGTTTDSKIIAEIGTNNAQKSHYARKVYYNLERLFYWLDSTDLDAELTNPGPIIIREPILDSETGDVTIQKTYPESIQYHTPINYNKNQQDIPTYFYIDDQGERHEKITDGLTLEEIEANGYTVINTDAGEPKVNPDKILKSLGVKDEVNGCESVPASGGGFITTFEKDSRGYRVEKFRNEFDSHLDKHYCCVYFIMTELLLCYDSRGKNMMMSTWGPLQEGGEYIWYPIFYDIDTQLGLNNSGAYLWDYDADVTLDGLFSTPGSVLWNNLFEIFRDDIINTYRILRGLAVDDSTRKITKSLTYENITGAYECNGNTFNSYAMKGLRPVIAIGLDEYYKYFATTTASKVGYFDTKGDLIKEGSPSYAYCCQGDKILTTELLLRNRLNYIDSWWIGGDYQIEQIKGSTTWMRVSGNRASETSDKYLQLSQEEIDNRALTKPAYNGVISGTWPVEYFDSRPGFKLKPFLKQYIFYYTDEQAGANKKYNDSSEEQDGIWTEVPASKLGSYLTDLNSPNSQLCYIPGMNYLSSLGDLSLSYVDEFHLNQGLRLLDITLGSDVPGYYNSLLTAGSGNDKKFNLNDSLNDIETNNHKPLLQKVILTGLTNLVDSIDLSASPKLQEFRALNTPITNVSFAAGAPLHTIHLPNTVTALAITEATDLNKLISTTPIIGDYDAENNVFTPRDPETYRGLYIQDVTDVTSAKYGTGHKLQNLIINGGNMGYESYKLLNNLVKIKQGATANNILRVNLTNVQWTPYTLVPYGEAQNLNTTYYYLTDHSTYEEYEGTSPTDWNSYTLNEKIYTFNETAPKELITSLDILDTFRTDYSSASIAAEQHFTNTGNLSAKSVPTITGNLFINNTSETIIDEADINNIYKALWPDLKIQAQYVKQAYIAKYVQILDSGKENEIDIIRYAKNPDTHPTITGRSAAKQNYDFRGWSLNKNHAIMTADDFMEASGRGEIYNTNDDLSRLTFDDDHDNYVFYAVFTIKAYNIYFKNYIPGVDETNYPILYTDKVNNGDFLREPPILPSVDESNLEFDKRYKFIGWVLEPSDNNCYPQNERLAKTVNITNIISQNMDRTFYACYIQENARDNITDGDNIAKLDSKYFKFDNCSVLDKITGQSVSGYAISVKDDVSLRGKITLPTVYNNAPILKISGFGGGQAMSTDQSATRGGMITHIFWKGEPNLIEIDEQTFSGCVNLRYFEMPGTIQYIKSSAFYNCRLLDWIDFSETNLVEIGMAAFQLALTSWSSAESLDLKFPSTLESLGERAFYNIGADEDFWGGLSVRPAGIFIRNDTDEIIGCRLGSIEFGNNEKGSSLNSALSNVIKTSGGLFFFNDAKLYYTPGANPNIYWNPAYFNTEHPVPEDSGYLTNIAEQMSNVGIDPISQIQLVQASGG